MRAKRRLQKSLLQYVLVIIGTIATSPLPAIAQRIPIADETLGNERSIVSPDEVIRDIISNRIDGGARRGGNLFHSFRDFNINEGRGAYFSNPDGVANILARVTGGSRSDILGRLGVLGNADLFLINPNGILFGPNARLDLGGSFITSTANSIMFDDGFAFGATDPQAPPLLTVNVPIGWQYGSNNLGAIQVQGASLQIPDGQTLTLAGGVVTIDGGELLAPGGRVELVGVAAPGEVRLTQQGQKWRLSVPQGLARADVAIGNDAIVDVSSGEGGSITITAQNLTIAGAGTEVLAGIAESSGVVGNRAGDIVINATEAFSIDDSLVSNEVQQGGTGNAGDIRITIGTLSLTHGGEINASTEGQGDAGSIIITASNTLSFDGVGSDRFASGAFSVVGSEGLGQGGNIRITTGTLSLSNGAQVSASTFGRGGAGSITITARDTLSFNGVGSNGFPSAAGSVVGSEGLGQGGNIRITTGTLSLSNGAQVDASTFGRGDAGSITITARDALFFEGVGSDQISSGVFTAVEPGALGQGGRIRVETVRFSITNGAELSAASEGKGNAGSLNVNAYELRLDQGAIGTETASGRGGDITLQVSALLLLRRESNISTTAGTNRKGGDGGNITLNSDFIVAVSNENSDISANAFTGRGGNVEINAQGIFGIEFRSQLTSLSDITASSERGIAGVVAINTPDVDPTRGLVQLPVEVTDASRLNAQTCPTGNSANNQPSEFIITGRGGLPPTPREATQQDAIQVDLVTIDAQTEPSVSQLESQNRVSLSPESPLMEAQGWQIAADGTVTLVAAIPQRAIGRRSDRLIHCD